ncbi:2-dehydropantoate 2-reductase [Bacillus sp. REN10]|uniref:2-dehydropantoate 2-reductase n=1 Tax=Bacillus sp. REN10 TaxID=2782541 RepID=UPI00193C7558
MKIGIVGGGAIGLLFASQLADVYPTVVFAKTTEQAEALAEQGITYIENHQMVRRFVQADVTEHIDQYQLDLLFIAVKQYQLPIIWSYVERINQEVPLVFLQNGMGHLEALDRLPHKHLFVATVEHGVLRTEATSIEIRGRNQTNISAYRGDRKKLLSFLTPFKVTFPFVWSEKTRSMLLEKLAVNVVINPLTALLKVPNGELVTNPFFLNLAHTVFVELSTVFPDEMDEGVWPKIKGICVKTANNRSSMLTDLEKGRQTEIDAIVGYVLKEANKYGVDVPVLNTMYSMMKGLEKKDIH